MLTLEYSNKLAELIGLKYDIKDLNYGFVFYSMEDSPENYLYLITRNGRGEQLKEYYYKASLDATKYLAANLTI